MIFTWNTQGNWQHGPKRTIIEQQLSGGCDIAMIQEGGGSNGNRGYKQVGSIYGVWGAAPGAFNTRCTNWILSRHGGKPWYSKTIGGGVAGRQAAGLLVKGVLFVSWHSTAANGVDADTADLFRECLMLVKGGAVRKVLVGADFNTSLTNMIGLTNRLTTGRQYGDCVCNIFYSSDPTHKSGRTLDFFVLLEKGLVVHDYGIRVRRVVPSDHHPVILNPKNALS